MASSIAVATPCSSSTYPSNSSLYYNFFKSSIVQTWRIEPPKFHNFKQFSLVFKSRRNLVCAVSRDAEEAFKKTVEVDRLIDTLRDASHNELPKLVAENVLAFNEGFWIRLAARTNVSNLGYHGKFPLLLSHSTLHSVFFGI